MTRFFQSTRAALLMLVLSSSGVVLAEGEDPKKPGAAEDPKKAGDPPAEDPKKPGDASAAGEKPAEPPAKGPGKKPAAAQPAAPIEPVIEKLSHGQVDWTSKTLRITGSGAPNSKLANVAAIRLNAEKAAKLAAYRNVIEALKGIRIADKELAGDRLGQSLVRGQVEGVVETCKTVDTRYFADGGVDVEIECPIDGALAYAVAPPKDFQPLDEAGEAKYTGVIIDLGGAPAAFAIAPRVLAGEKVIYAQEHVKTKYLRKHGSIAYFRNADSAKASQRVGASPLVVKGTPVAGSADISISSEDAGKIDAAGRTYLSEGRFAIVLGK
ncbi:MAG: hypothetical protein HYV07_26500 [Deltaproteobacteria bacterium]|nr:hypothetical protein [Deltaproteobacteria bacterium]